MNDLIKLYKKVISEEEGKLEEINKDYWRLGYHLMPPVGWLNDPNGLCEFKGLYHVFYQYAPTNADGGLKFWGHYTTKDFINWTKHDVAIYPDQVFDLHGVFSGSSFIEDGKMHCYYTGTVMREGYNDNYEVEGMEQNTILVTSKDGFTFSDKKVLLTNDNYPNMSWHVRDPKVWKEDNNYYMVLGGRSEKGEGCILLYTSKDKENWNYLNTIKTNEKFGYMWECPDLFNINGDTILITCPQGAPQDGVDIVNVHQCGYFVIEGDLTGQDYKFSNFIPLDRGFDMYAPQSFIDSKGRRILIGWLSISDTPFGYPTKEIGWNHCLSIPRELDFKDGRLIQKPLSELVNLRDEEFQFKVVNGKIDKELFLDKYEMIMDFENSPYEVFINLKKDINVSYVNEDKVFKLSFGKAGYGRDERKVKIEELKDLRIFIDTSSIEIFINGGSEVFSSRVFPSKEDKGINIYGENLSIDGVIYSLKDFNYSKS